MDNLSKLRFYISKRRKLKYLFDSNAENIKSILGKIDLKEFEEDKLCDYNALKTIINDISHLIPENRKEAFYDFLNRKKTEEYLQLLKATYFPEINQLDIPDEEKVRLDNAARANDRYYMTEDNISSLRYKLSIQDLDMLASVGVVEKKYAIKCPVCEFSLVLLTQKQYESYQRCFELMSKQDNLSEDEENEVDELVDEGFYELYVYCDDCDEEIEIDSLSEWLKFKNRFEDVYKVVKQPDLTYERL